MPLDGNARGYRVSIGNNQTLNLPWININQVLIQFSEDVGASLAASDFNFTGIGGIRVDGATGSTPRVDSYTYNSSTFVATLNLSQSLDPSRLTLNILASSISDVSKNTLDGEWTTGVTSQSGNGSVGGDFAFVFHVVPGDINRDGFVTTADGDLIPSTRNFTSPFYTIWGDINGSNIINADDRDKRCPSNWLKTESIGLWGFR